MSIELPAATRHRRDMTEKLLKRMLTPNKQPQQTLSAPVYQPHHKKQFSRVNNLRTRMFVHSGEKPHTCDICKKQFLRVSYLRTHMFVHTGEKPYTCDICKKQFIQVGHLKAHMLIHTGENPHSYV